MHISVKGEEAEVFLALDYATCIAETIFILICILILQDDILKWMLSETVA